MGEGVVKQNKSKQVLYLNIIYMVFAIFMQQGILHKLIIEVPSNTIYYHAYLVIIISIIQTVGVVVNQSLNIVKDTNRQDEFSELPMFTLSIKECIHNFLKVFLMVLFIWGLVFVHIKLYMMANADNTLTLMGLYSMGYFLVAVPLTYVIVNTLLNTLMATLVYHPDTNFKDTFKIAYKNKSNKIVIRSLMMMFAQIVLILFEQMWLVLPVLIVSQQIYLTKLYKLKEANEDIDKLKTEQAIKTINPQSQSVLVWVLRVMAMIVYYLQIPNIQLYVNKLLVNVSALEVTGLLYTMFYLVMLVILVSLPHMIVGAYQTYLYQVRYKQNQKEGVLGLVVKGGVKDFLTTLIIITVIMGATTLFGLDELFQIAALIVLNLPTFCALLTLLLYIKQLVLIGDTDIRIRNIPKALINLYKNNKHGINGIGLALMFAYWMMFMSAGTNNFWIDVYLMFPIFNLAITDLVLNRLNRMVGEDDAHE